VRDVSSANSLDEGANRDPFAGHVERELRGYLAAVEEGLPVFEPRSSAVAAVVFREIVSALLHAAAVGLRAWWRGLPWSGASPLSPVDDESAPATNPPMRQRRLRFARYLFQHGRING
jgi:hypothetical protein